MSILSRKKIPEGTEDYEVLETVGCGSFAKVSKVRRKSTKDILVWKELLYGNMSDKEKQMLCDEVNILRNLNHPNIVSFVDRIIDHSNRRIFIIQEYCNGGDLATYIKLKKNKKELISENFIWSILSEICSALQHCHNHISKIDAKNNSKKLRILHRDLKPGNVFLIKKPIYDKKSYSISVKLGDFGLAKCLDEKSGFAQTHVGTPYYMSPEQIQSNGYNEQSDIWSLGCMAYEMCMLSPPFKANNYIELAEKIKSGKYKKISSKYSLELADCISSMLKIAPFERPTVNQLLSLPRIQLQNKMSRIERRYALIKRKEHNQNIKAQQLRDWEKRLKERELLLLQKENLFNKERMNFYKNLKLISNYNIHNNNRPLSTISTSSSSHSGTITVSSTTSSPSVSDTNHTNFIKNQYAVSPQHTISINSSLCHSHSSQ